MKKLISLLAALSVVTAFSVGATATEFTVDGSQTGLTATDVAQQEKYEKGNNGLYTVDLSAVATVQGELQAQTTILAVKGNTISVGSIQYIGQSATPTFTFDLKDELTGNDRVNVLAGGSSISPTLVGYMEAAQEPTTFTISGTVSGYAAGTTLPVVKITKGTDTYTATVVEGGAYTIENVPAGDYTFTITKAAHITYTSPLTISADKAVADIAIYSGDTSGDTVIDVSDFTAIGNNFGTSLATDGEAFVKAADTNDDDVVDVGDFTAIGNNFGKSATTDYTNIQ